MLKVTIEATGHTRGDLTLAIQEALNRIENGYTTGMDRNETGSFTFAVDGQEEDEEDNQEEQQEG